MISSWVIVLILGIFTGASRADGYTERETAKTQLQQFCMDVPKQYSLNLHEIMGMWYGSEIIQHSESIPGTYYFDSCVLIHLTDVTDQITTTTAKVRDYNVHFRKVTPQSTEPKHRFLRLVWDEKENTLEYTLNYTESNPGLWASETDQRGTMLDFHYEQFRGTIQVVKAVHDHIVLTFCDLRVHNSFFTIVLTRRPQGLSEEELRSIRSLLERRGLSTKTIRKVCTSGASYLVPSIALLAFISTLLHLRNKY